VASFFAFAGFFDGEAFELPGFTEVLAAFFVAFLFAGLVAFAEVFLFELFPAAMLVAPDG
jgi:hypothetical protein